MQISPKSLIATSIAPQKSTALYQVHFFGPFRVMRDNQPVGEPMWRRDKARMLLKWFLLNAGRKFSADQLIAVGWPDMSKAAAIRNFHVTIHYLRHLLEPDLSPRHESSYIRRNKNNLYWFECDESWWVDIFDVHYHYTQATEAEQYNKPAAAIAHYRQIVEYCSPGFLHEDVYEEAFSLYRRYYERLQVDVLGRLMHLYTQEDMLDEALTYAHHALLVDPYCETAIKVIAHAYFRQGNTAGAIHKLDYFQAFLKEDLDLEPGEDILSLRKSMAELEK